MRCPHCGCENRTGAKFCNECGAPLPAHCDACGVENRPGANFCDACGTSLATPSAASSHQRPDSVTLAAQALAPIAYTPAHLTEKIRHATTALAGERKQVTVLFADLKGSMELLADRDPEEARQLLDPVLERLMAAVHRYEGTVNQVMGDGIRQTATSLDGTRRYEHLGDVVLPAVFSRALLAWCHAELGMCAEGSFLGKEGLQIAEAVAHPGSLMLALLWDWFACPSAKATCAGLLPQLERAMGICQDADLPVYFPRMAAALGAAYTLDGRVADAVPLLTQTMEQTYCNGKSRHFRRSVVSLWERRICWLATWRRRTPLLSGHWRSLVGIKNVATRRMPCASSARLLRGVSPRRARWPEAHYREALTLAEEFGMRPLQAHCHRGLGTLYRQDRAAGAGSC